MRTRCLSLRGGVLAAILIAGVGVTAGQTRQTRNQAPANPVWKVPRTPDGQPDLQGYWTNVTLTPLQRPANLADKEFFTPAEAEAYETQLSTRTMRTGVTGQRPRTSAGHTTTSGGIAERRS